MLLLQKYKNKNSDKKNKTFKFVYYGTYYAAFREEFLF